MGSSQTAFIVLEKTKILSTTKTQMRILISCFETNLSLFRIICLDVPHMVPVKTFNGLQFGGRYKYKESLLGELLNSRLNCFDSASNPKSVFLFSFQCICLLENVKGTSLAQWRSLCEHRHHSSRRPLAALQKIVQFGFTENLIVSL